MIGLAKLIKQPGTKAYAKLLKKQESHSFQNIPDMSATKFNFISPYILKHKLNFHHTRIAYFYTHNHCYMNWIKITCALTLGIILSVALFGKSHKINVRKHTQSFFFDAGFTGELKDVFRSKGGVGLKLHNGKRYVFYPATSQKDKVVKQLEIISLEKNKVHKNAFSDTFSIIADEQVFLFTSVQQD
jgi:hypothetical protein